MRRALGLIGWDESGHGVGTGAGRVVATWRAGRGWCGGCGERCAAVSGVRIGAAWGVRIGAAWGVRIGAAWGGAVYWYGVW